MSVTATLCTRDIRARHQRVSRRQDQIDQQRHWWRASRIAGVLTMMLTAFLSAWLAPAAALGTQDAARLVPWLDLGPEWTLGVTPEGVVTATPGDLPGGAELLFLIEPVRELPGSLDADYEQALVDLGPWRPIDTPLLQQTDSGWTFEFGLGVATLHDSTYTALTAVARKGRLLARFWVLADTDATYNRYQGAVMNAIGSLQDSTAPTQPAPPAESTTGPREAVDSSFGRGISGVYVGLERGLGANAAGNAIADYEEVDVFYPDGTYRRRLPIRGIASDFSWERAQQPALWGAWRREGSNLVASRGDYQTIYTVQGDDLLDTRGRIWRKLVEPANQRLEGSFARADYRDAGAPRLVLRRDGSYEDRGDFLRMIGSAWNLVTPDGDAMLSSWSDAEARRALAGGAGSYSFDLFTLTLRSDDGRVWQINAYVPLGEDATRPERLVINGRPLLRD